MLLFPTVRDPVAANSMQVGEIQLYTTALVPEPTTLVLMALGIAAPGGGCRRRGVAASA